MGAGLVRGRRQGRTAAIRRSAAAAALGGLLGLMWALPAVAQDSQTVDDPETTRTVYLVIAGFVLLGVVLTAITVWFWRSTRPEHPALAPLEVMGDRGFWRLDSQQRAELLDGARPPGAQPDLQRVGRGLAGARRSEPALDLQRLVRETSDQPDTFADLLDPAPAPAAEPVPAAAPEVDVPSSDDPLAEFADLLTPSGETPAPEDGEGIGTGPVEPADEPADERP